MTEKNKTNKTKREDSGNEPKIWSKDITSAKYHSRSAKDKREKSEH